jgi:membrane protein implicated in regulation of membrane protease activity
VAHTASTSTGRSRSAGSDDNSVGTLVQNAMADMSVLIRNEIELAKSEIGRSAKKAGVSVALFAVAGVLLAFAGIYFFVFVAELIALVLPQWAAFLIVTGGLVVVAGLAALIGLRLLKKIDKPERTLESLRELPEVMRREAPGQRHRDVPTVNNGQVQLRGDSYVV